MPAPSTTSARRKEPGVPGLDTAESMPPGRWPKLSGARAGGVPEETLTPSTSPALVIPDASPIGARSTIIVASDLTISSIKVSVDITHTFIGDLKITLNPPLGTAIVLHDRNGGGTRQPAKTFDLSVDSGLGALTGKTAKGDWVAVRSGFGCGRHRSFESLVDGDQRHNRRVSSTSLRRRAWRFPTTVSPALSEHWL